MAEKTRKRGLFGRFSRAKVGTTNAPGAANAPQDELPLAEATPEAAAPPDDHHDALLAFAAWGAHEASHSQFASHAAATEELAALRRRLDETEATLRAQAERADRAERAVAGLRAELARAVDLDAQRQADEDAAFRKSSEEDTAVLLQQLEGARRRERASATRAAREGRLRARHETLARRTSTRPSFERWRELARGRRVRGRRHLRAWHEHARAALRRREAWWTVIAAVNSAQRWDAEARRRAGGGAARAAESGAGARSEADAATARLRSLLSSERARAVVDHAWPHLRQTSDELGARARRRAARNEPAARDRAVYELTAEEERELRRRQRQEAAAIATGFTPAVSAYKTVY